LSLLFGSGGECREYPTAHTFGRPSDLLLAVSLLLVLTVNVPALSGLISRVLAVAVFGLA
jgi:hypothetical protein